MADPRSIEQIEAEQAEARRDMSGGYVHGRCKDCDARALMYGVSKHAPAQRCFGCAYSLRRRAGEED